MRAIGPCDASRCGIVIDARLRNAPAGTDPGWRRDADRLRPGRPTSARVVLEAHGAEIIELPNPSGRSICRASCSALPSAESTNCSPRRASDSTVRSSAGCVDELVLYLAPSLLGPTRSGWVNLPAIESLAAGRKMRFHDVRKSAEDLRLVTRWAD